MAITNMDKDEMLAVLEHSIFNRGEASIVTLYGYALDWALNYLDRTAAARGFVFSDLNREDVYSTTISGTFTATASTNKLDVDIDIPTGTRIRFTTTNELPNITFDFATTDVDADTDIITIPVNIADGTEIKFTGDDLPTELTIGTTYYCLRQSATTIKVAETEGGAAMDISEGSGTITTYSGGLTVDTDYWARNIDSDTIQVATSYANTWVPTVVDIAGTTTGTHTITAYRERFAKPSECRYIYDLRLIDGAMSRPLIAMTPRRLDLFVPFAASCNPARPTHYIEWKDWLQLYPIPNATYVIKMRYCKWQTAFADGDATAEIDHIDDIIINAAAMYVWTMQGEPEQAALMKKTVDEALFKCGKLEKMKPDLVLKPHMGTIARADSDTQADPFVRSQR